MKPRVSIIIVHYKAQRELIGCLRSIKASKPKVSYEVIVVDNEGRGSLKKTLKEKFSSTRYIKAPENIGFGAGNNLGAKEARGEFLFFLNPDTEAKPRTIDILVDFLEKNEKAGIVAPLLLNAHGRPYNLQGSGALNPSSGIFGLSFLNKLFPNNPISKKYWLLEWDKKKAREVDVVPGTAFMIKRKLFENIRGFDERFFLYFEEVDLCKRIKGAGWKIFIEPKAKVVHLWERSTRRVGKNFIKSQFSKSRFYYFKKHYGFLWAILVHLFASLGRRQGALLGILGLAAFLRFWRINELMMFIGDFGWFYLSARDMLLGQGIPLVGISSSVPVFKQGALWTWILSGSLWLGKFHPASGAVFAATVGVAAVWGVYKILSEWFSKEIGLFGAFLTATSPLIVIHSRMPYHTAPIFPATLLLAWSLTKAGQGNRMHLFFSGLWLAMLYQLELAAFILIPVALFVVGWHRQKPLATLPRISAGFVLGIAPFIVWDLKQGVPLQTLGFPAWAALRAWEGIVGLSRGGGDYSQAFLYFSRLVFPAWEFLAFALLVVSVGLFVTQVYKRRRNLSFSEKLLLSWGVFAGGGFILRGTIAEAYMPLVFLPVVALLSLLAKTFVRSWGKIFWILPIVLAAINGLFLLKSDYFMPRNYGVGLSQRLALVDFIVTDAQGRPYKLDYRGPGYMFAAGDDHYYYLLWWKGNEPSEGATLTYALYEGEQEPHGAFDRIEDFGYAKVAVRYD